MGTHNRQRASVRALPGILYVAQLPALASWPDERHAQRERGSKTRVRHRCPVGDPGKPLYDAQQAGYMPLLVQRNAGVVRFDSCERKMLDSASIRESRTLVCGDKHHYTLPLAASGV